MAIAILFLWTIFCHWIIFHVPRGIAYVKSLKYFLQAIHMSTFITFKKSQNSKQFLIKIYIQKLRYESPDNKDYLSNSSVVDTSSSLTIALRFSRTTLELQFYRFYEVIRECRVWDTLTNPKEHRCARQREVESAIFENIASRASDSTFDFYSRRNVTRFTHFATQNHLSGTTSPEHGRDKSLRRCETENSFTM